MSEKGAMKQNLRSDKTNYTAPIANSIKRILRQPYFVVKYWTYGVDTDNNDILVFFHLKSVEEMNYGKYHFFVSLQNSWRALGYKVIERTELPSYEYKLVGFASVCFRLKKIVYNAP